MVLAHVVGQGDARAGMIMRNSVIPVGRIEQDIADGKAPWEALVDSTAPTRLFLPALYAAWYRVRPVTSSSPVLC